MKGWNAFLDKYYPEADRADASVMYGYTVAQGLVHVLKNCGNDLTRENIMKQAASIKDLELPGLLPGIKVNTSATDFAPISSVQLMRFKGETWERFGDIISVRRRRLDHVQNWLLKKQPLRTCRRGFLLSRRRQNGIERANRNKSLRSRGRDIDHSEF